MIYRCPFALSILRTNLVSRAPLIERRSLRVLSETVIMLAILVASGTGCGNTKPATLRSIGVRDVVTNAYVLGPRKASFHVRIDLTKPWNMSLKGCLSITSPIERTICGQPRVYPWYDYKRKMIWLWIQPVSGVPSGTEVTMKVTIESNKVRITRQYQRVVREGDSRGGA